MTWVCMSTRRLQIIVLESVAAVLWQASLYL
jgi:hypothetical protein